MSATLCALIAPAVAQGVTIRAPIRADRDLLSGAQARKDPGPTVQMLESPNIDRFLRRAQDFLSRDDYAGAIAILQDVVEGRTLEEPIAGADQPEPEPQENAGRQPAGQKPRGGDATWTELTEDPKNAVFSNDQRLFRPVKRLCHELLSALPPEGIARYRADWEVTAEQEFAAAQSTGAIHELEDVYNHYFVTVTAARAMVAAGDLRMDEGTFRAAVQTYRLLLEVYPSEGRELAGISDTTVLFKIALCFEQLGDGRKAQDVLASIERDQPGATLRVMGELHSIAELAASDMFRAHVVDEDVTASSPVASALQSAHERLVPLWEHRFEEQRPYRAAKVQNNSRRISIGPSGSEMTPTPKYNAYVPGPTVHFFGDRLTFLDHFMLRVSEPLSGRLVAQIAETEGRLVPRKPQANRPHSRIPAYDFASMNVAADAERYFVVFGPTSSTSSGMKAVLDTRVIAFARSDLRKLWDSDEYPEYRNMTFMATPTRFGSRLLVPVAERGTFSLQAMDAASGAPLFRVHIHREGSVMARPPASPVMVDAGVAYVLTNAGAIASIDAYTGALRWVRRYERAHPLRPLKRRGTRPRNANPFGGRFFEQVRLTGFAPSEILAVDGTIIVAPCDANVLHCLDGATGEPLWMLSERQTVPAYNLEYLIGHDGRRLYVGTESGVMCIGLKNGVRYWHDDLAGPYGLDRWNGRGVVNDDLLIVPGSTRQLLVRPTNDGGTWSRLPLPNLSQSVEPLSGPFNIALQGPFIALTFEGGIEMYSTESALATLADGTSDPLQRSVFEAQSGDLLSSIQSLEAVEPGDPERDRTVSTRMLALCSELAVVMATHGARKDALALLDRCAERVVGRDHRMRWHLARLEVFRTLGDLKAIEVEQEALYEIMGKRPPK